MIDSHEEHKNQLSQFSNVQNLIEEKNISIFKETNNNKRRINFKICFNLKKC